MAKAKQPRGRKKKYAEYEELLASIAPRSMSKRPKYIRGIGIFRGKTGDTAWVKVYLRHGTTYQNKSYRANTHIEIKLGSLSSFTWEQLDHIFSELQGKADRGEALEDVTIPLFKTYALRWLDQSKTRMVPRG